MPARLSVFTLVLASCCAALPACGRKTLIKPPELVAPERIDSLAAVNGADGIQLSWRRPTKYADGARMYDLGAFRIERSVGGAPFVPLATVEVTDRERLQQARRFRWLDVETVVGQTYDYRVTSLTTDGYVSQASNITTLERALPTPAPPRKGTPQMNTDPNPPPDQ